MLSKYLIFADGGNHKGYGHLSRMKTLINKLKIKNHSTILYENIGQKTFWLENGFSKIFFLENTSQILKNKHHIFIIDSKDNRSDLIKKFKEFTTKRVVIDNQTSMISEIDFQIIPTFYSQDIDIPVSTNHNPKTGSGIGYIIIDDVFLEPHHRYKKKKLVLSFGGNDPNNLTLKLLKKLSPIKEFSNDIIVILGPGYNYNISEIHKLCRKDQIIINPRNIHHFFRQSYMVITALGVTVQELFCAGIPTAVICNYDSDMDDVKKISKFSKKIRPHDSLVKSYGHFDRVKFQQLNKDIMIRKLSNDINKPLMNAGIRWDSFLNDINN
jgi:spore coat polysaccharide biosynthesis predicted glycosyltransferase SpsG